MDVPEDVPPDDIVELHPDRAETLRATRRPRRKIQPQQLLGGILFLAILAGGVAYFVINQPSSTLRGAETGLNITPKTNNSFADLVIASKGEPEPETAPQTANIVEAALVPDTAPAPEFVERDSDATLQRLTELTEKNAEATGLIKTLRADLKRANDQAVELTQQIKNLEAEITTANDLGESLITKHTAKIDQLRLEYETQLTALRGQLELAHAQAPVDHNTDAERLEAARKRRQAQIESEAVIFDNSQNDNSNAIRY